MIVHFSKLLKLCLKTESTEKEQWWLITIVLLLTLSWDVLGLSLHMKASKLCSKFLLHLTSCEAFTRFWTDEENREDLLHLGPRIGGGKDSQAHSYKQTVLVHWFSQDSSYSVWGPSTVLHMWTFRSYFQCLWETYKLFHECSLGTSLGKGQIPITTPGFVINWGQGCHCIF